MSCIALSSSSSSSLLVERIYLAISVRYVSVCALLFRAFSFCSVVSIFRRSSFRFHIPFHAKNNIFILVAVGWCFVGYVRGTSVHRGIHTHTHDDAPTKICCFFISFNIYFSSIKTVCMCREIEIDILYILSLYMVRRVWLTFQMRLWLWRLSIVALFFLLHALISYALWTTGILN